MKSFTGVNTWIFDLDNTLYPSSCRLFDQMHVKMSNYVMRRFNVDFPEARRIQKELYHRHGTTLRGLMVEHGEAPDDFLDQVHDIDYSAVMHSAALVNAIASLPGRKLVFTAGTKPHADRVLARLGLSGAFDAVFDIVDAAYIPKPQQEPYDRFLQMHHITPASAAFFEDIARNLEVPHAMGMVTVLVEGEDQAANMAHVHHVTADLPHFLLSRASDAAVSLIHRTNALASGCSVLPTGSNR